MGKMTSRGKKKITPRRRQKPVSHLSKIIWTFGKVLCHLRTEILNFFVYVYSVKADITKSNLIHFNTVVVV